MQKDNAPNFDIRQGDVLERLREMPEASVHCCVTSPPYWGLRDYGMPGQIGLEKTPDEYVAKIVEVFREVRRVLRPDGTCWLNLGDSYNSGSSGGLGGSTLSGGQANQAKSNRARRPLMAALKPKDLIGIPWRVAFALQSDGWYLRSDIIWAKPNPMPESVTDRPTKAHEYLFLLSKSPKYFYDASAIAEPSNGWNGSSFHDERDLLLHPNTGRTPRPSAVKGSFGGKTEAMSETGQNAFRAVTETRNKRSVWTLATLPTPEAHFATFPIELPEICIKAGCPEGGTVLDPFSGAGTTGLACLKNGRDYIGIELNPEYIEISHQRGRKYFPLLLMQT